MAKSSGTNVLYGLIAESKQYDDTIVLGRGDPDFNTPENITDAGTRALTNFSEVSPVEGILPLRQAIAERVQKINGITVNPETEVVVTNGGQEALFLMVLTVIGKGDGLLVPEPNYNTYKDAVRFAGGHIVSMPTYSNEAFRVDPQRVKATITKDTKAILLVSPNNPAASVITKEDLLAIIQIAQDHDLYIISDDIYDLLIYDTFKHTSVASLPGGFERTLTLNALSKTYAMTGWRTGWTVGPEPLMRKLKQLKASVSGAASLASQYAALEALTGPQDSMNAMANAYHERRRMVLAALDEMGFKYGRPQGGQFVFVNVSHTGMSSIDLATEILKREHVLAYPGGAFSQDMDNFIRITFLQDEATLQDGLTRMKRAMDALSPKA